MSNKDWKDHLLKSGLPLEFEVVKFLDAKGCVSYTEYTYQRNNESDISTEFSYDIDSSYIRGNHFMDLMIECKYRHESTKWMFLPDDYGTVDDIGRVDFMHRCDHFNTNRQDQIDFPLEFAPLCSKGIELTTDGANPKTITQAIAQLSYAMAQKITNAIDHQTDDILRQQFDGTIFYSIPIIITTAKLFRIREGIDIQTIKAAETIEDISTEHPYLIIKSKPRTHLVTYNRDIFQDFVLGKGKEFLENQLNTYSDDLWFVLSNLAKDNCPNSIVVLHHTTDNSSLTDLFKFIDRVINPDKEIFDLVKQKHQEMDNFFKKFERDNPGVDLTGGVK